MNEQREWYNEIIHWANGGEIERYDALTSEWEDDPHPDFWSYTQYRININSGRTYWCYRPIDEVNAKWKLLNDGQKYTKIELEQTLGNLSEWEYYPIY